MTAPARDAVVVIGNFDGVHRGHQAVLAQAKAIAASLSLRCVVLTFDPHPTVVLGRTPPPRLATLGRRIELLRRHGADDVVVEPFTKELAACSPERFARELLAERLGARAVVVGHDFRFGKGRAGDLGTLRALGGALGFDAIAAEACGDAVGPFSSTRARDAIAAGDLDGAREVLGRWHAISGVVERGDQLGRTIGFPTANLGGTTELLPPYGIYAVVVDRLDDADPRLPSAARALAHGALSIGVRPTVGGTTLRVEVYLFDRDRDLYGAALRVHLVARLRDEAKLPDLDALKAQIARDVSASRALLAPIRPAPSGAYG